MDRVVPVNEQNVNYKYFDSVAYAPGRAVPMSEKTPFLIKEELFFQEYLKTGLADKEYLESLATMRGVKPTRRNMTKSIEKCDTKPSEVEDDLQLYVDDLVHQYLGPYLTVPPCNSNHNYDINGTSSPGKFWKRLGCKTKAQALNHPLFMTYLVSTDHIPICDYNGKTELLDSDLISEGKIRGTFNPPVDFVMKQKYLYDLQNTSLLLHNAELWIKYGFVKQFGGMDKMGKLLEECDIISDDDCIGYDRIAWLKKVYYLRNRYLQYPENQQSLVDYVTYFTMHAYVACPDGVIRRRATGNISGSNNTTCDNSILHVFIQMRFIVELYIKYLNRRPSLEEVVTCVECYIYSDDNTCGYSFPFHVPLDEFYELKKLVYRKFGFELKPDQKELSNPKPKDLGEHSFLGSYFHWDEEYEMYIPFPRVEKIASSLFYSIDSKEDIDVLAKAHALTVLSCMVPKLGDECRKFLKFLLSRIPKPEQVLGFEGMQLINSALENPKVFYFQLMGRQSSFLGGGRNKIIMSEAVANNIPLIEKKIDTMVAKVGGSEEGALWVKEALDPFNDEPRRVVGFPDLITGGSITQAIKKSFQIQVGATAEDVHIFFDNLDTQTVLYENTKYAVPTTRYNTYLADAVGGIGAIGRGGVVVRRGAVGTNLYMQSGSASTTYLDQKYTTDGPVRVLSKAFEVHNTTPQLSVGGAVAVYRNASSSAYNDQNVANLLLPATPTNGLSYQARRLVVPPSNLSEVMIIPGAQQWNAKEGCYVVCTMCSQTNNPQEEMRCVNIALDPGTTGSKEWVNTFAEAGSVLPKPTDTGDALYSPFFMSGAYFSGLPAGSTLTVNVIWIIERFVDYDSELVTLSQPSPYYDPVAMELYSKSAGKLPAGVKVGWNADGDWIKNIADVLSTFGVPGMPLVKGAVDLWNGFKPKDDPASKVGRITNSPQFANNSRPKKPRRPAPMRLPPPNPGWYNQPMHMLPPPMNANASKKRRRNKKKT